MYMLCFCVPETHLELVKNAIFDTGAGSVDHYQHCAWQTLGEGAIYAITWQPCFYWRNQSA
ncbi:hypothetical protein LEAN103870_06935 [Legionella anisa]|nr:hypothetical protein Lani_2956 [Legionella anisa]